MTSLLSMPDLPCLRLNFFQKLAFTADCFLMVGVNLTRSKNILVLRHSSSVGPGYLEDFIKRRGLTQHLLDLHEGASLPANPDEFGAVIVLGGEMNAYAEDSFPFLKKENDFIRRTVQHGVPFLGLCLGGQLLAKALGGKVTKNSEKEIGPYEIALTEEGARDPLFAGFSERFPFCQWHGDTFSSLPSDSVLLASSATCKHQAFRHGTNAYGVQFHPEVTPLVLESWCHDFSSDLTSSQHGIEVKKRYALCAADCIKLSDRLFKNFFLIARVLAG